MHVNKRGETAVTHSERAAYSLAGQATAVRVSGDPDPANNGRFYLYTDHPSTLLRTGLGSTSAMSDENGNLVGSVTRYTPFGDYRSGGPNGITGRAFTGQKENMADLGLYYYNARWYSPSLARFLSADTLVPEPTSPQSLNRYTYVFNRPLNFIDPSGHDGMWCNDPHEGTGCNGDNDAIDPYHDDLMLATLLTLRELETQGLIKNSRINLDTVYRTPADAHRYAVFFAIANPQLLIIPLELIPNVSSQR